ncbi:hypothetical protein FMH07_00345 [Vibrio parahaemolyticus]|nr:hypothetical protein [Vibrio parahaemolyticus]
MREAYSYIRLSHTNQLSGHGRQRQLESTVRAAKEKGWQLMDETFEDLGVSGFKGINVETGAFSKFLTAVQQGAIREGSVLIVENVDRLSRAGVNRAVTLMLQLLEYGITIHTLSDNKTYEPSSENPLMDLMQWALTAQRGYEESLIKSKRIQAVKDAVREKARKEGTYYTTKSPSWIIISPDKKEATFHPTNAAIVKVVIDLYLNGYGTTRIANRMIELGHPTLSVKSKCWNASLVRSLLTQPALSGDIMFKRNGKRDPDILEDYYPALIDKDTHRKIKERLAKGGAGKGRRSTTMRNPLAGLLRCKCGSGLGLSHNNARKHSNPRTALRCKKYYGECNGSGISAPRAITGILYGLRRLPMATLLTEEKKVDRVSVEVEIRSLTDSLEGIKQSMDNVITTIAAVGGNKALQEKLIELTAEQDAIEKKRDALRKQLEAIDALQVTEDLETLEERFTKLLDQTSTEEGRTALNGLLRDHLSHILVDTDGEQKMLIAFNKKQQPIIEVTVRAEGEVAVKVGKEVEVINVPQIALPW